MEGMEYYVLQNILAPAGKKMIQQISMENGD
jgi:hypothetical protein